MRPTAEELKEIYKDYCEELDDLDGQIEDLQSQMLRISAKCQTLMISIRKIRGEKCDCFALDIPCCHDRNKTVKSRSCSDT